MRNLVESQIKYGDISYYGDILNQISGHMASVVQYPINFVTSLFILEQNLDIKSNSANYNMRSLVECQSEFLDI